MVVHYVYIVYPFTSSVDRQCGNEKRSHPYSNNQFFSCKTIKIKVDLLIHPSLAAAAAAAASSSRMMSASPPSHSHSPPSNGASTSNSGGGSSSDACNGIVANLLCHRQRTNGESETFAKRAIER
jgi:hypothetical protein